MRGDGSDESDAPAEVSTRLNCGGRRRPAFIKGILAELVRAIADGAKLRPFHAWSLMDNFEWMDGYGERVARRTPISAIGSGQGRIRGCGAAAWRRPTGWLKDSIGGINAHLASRPIMKNGRLRSEPC